MPKRAGSKRCLLEVPTVIQLLLLVLNMVILLHNIFKRDKYENRRIYYNPFVNYKHEYLSHVTHIVTAIIHVFYLDLVD